MVYVSSDWHGMELENVKALLKTVNFSDDDYLFILGDVIDRGKHGVDILKYIMFEPNIKLIRGNHEQMMLDCSFLLNEVSPDGITADDLRALQNWNANGGETTRAGLKKESPEMRQMIFDFVRETPFYDSVHLNDNDFLLVHAGLATDACGKFRKLSDSTEEDLIWIRPYLNTEYSHDFMTILGHTPTLFYGPEYKGKILRTDTWIDIDVGAAYDEDPVILRLDDLKEFYLS